MNQIQRTIKENVVDPHVLTTPTSTFGYVIKYNKMNNTAEVNVFDKRIGKYVIYENVYVSDNMRGSITKNIDTNTAVWIDFIGGHKNILRISDVWPEGMYTIENVASDNGQGIPDSKGLFDKIGDIVSGLFGR